MPLSPVYDVFYVLSEVDHSRYLVLFVAGLSGGGKVEEVEAEGSVGACAEQVGALLVHTYRRHKTVSIFELLYRQNVKLACVYRIYALLDLLT